MHQLRAHHEHECGESRMFCGCDSPGSVLAVTFQSSVPHLCLSTHVISRLYNLADLRHPNPLVIHRRTLFLLTTYSYTSCVTQLLPSDFIPGRPHIGDPPVCLLLAPSRRTVQSPPTWHRPSDHLALQSKPSVWSKLHCTELRNLYRWTTDARVG